MSIFVGNTLNFKLQIVAPNGLISTEGEFEVLRQEFNADSFQGVGYQRVLISENYGKEGAFGLGFNGEQTSVQVDAFPFALPLYRFDFSFLMDSDRLKLLYELFLRAYNFRAQGQNAQILMEDNKLYISEPIDNIHSRTGAIQGTAPEISDQVNLNYFLKTVEYIISWENFEWDHYLGDLYLINMLGTEVEVATDRNSGNSSFPGGSETVGGFEGFTITEITIPTTLNQPNNDAFAYSVGYAYPENRYFGHFSFDDDHVFVSWDSADPDGASKVEEQFTTTYTGYSLDTGPQNSYINRDRIPFQVYDNQSTSLHLREFRPFTTDTFAGNFRESATLPLLYYGNRTGVTTWQQPIQAGNNLYYVPNIFRDPATSLTSTSNEFHEFIEWGATNSQYRPTVGEYITAELNTTAFLTGAAQVEDNEQAGLPTLFPSKRQFAVNLCPGGLTDADGGFWYGYKLNVGTSTTLRVSFEFRLINSETGTFGDGLALVIQDDTRGVTARGGSGANLGFGGWSGTTYLSNIAITPSIAVTFDTYGNPAWGEPNIGDAVPHRVRVIKDGRTNAPLHEYNSSLDFRNKAYRCDITFDGTLNKVTISLEPIDMSSPPEVTDIPGFNLGLQLGSSTAYIGFTAGRSTVSDNDHYIDRLQINHNSTWFLPSSELNPEVYVMPTSDDPISNRNRTFLGTQSLGSPFFSYEGNVVSVNSPSEGDDIFYHIIRDPLNPNNTSIYKTVGVDYTNPSRVLINSVTDGSIPAFSRAINSPQNIRKFYLTQGFEGGNVYTTEDFFTYVSIGSWGELDASVSNEGQLYKFRERYLIRSPNLSIIDTNTDLFVDLVTLLCPGEELSTEGQGVFGVDREVIGIYPTPQDDTDYRDNNVEQLVIVSRDNNSQDDVRVFGFFPAETCPI